MPRKRKIPGSLRRRKEGGAWHYVVKIRGKRMERSTGETKQAAAWRVVEERLYPEARLLLAAPLGLPRLSEAIVAEVARVERGISERQADRLNYAMLNFLKWFGDAKINHITRHAINEYQRYRLGQGASSGTVRVERNAIIRMLRQHDIRIAPPERIKTVKTEVRAFTDEEMQQFFQACTHPRRRCLFLTMLATGARPAELIPSKRSKHRPLLKTEVNYDTGRITIRSAKQRGDRVKVRVIQVEPLLLGLLKSQAESHGGEYVFLPESNLDRDFNLILEAAGIPKRDSLGRKLIPHSFRHTYATKLARVLDQFALRDALGHDRISTTDRYVQAEGTVGAAVDLGEATKKPELKKIDGGKKGT